MQEKVLVIQSHTSPLPHSWLHSCMETVKHWARLQGFEYRFVGDELFAGVDPELRKKTTEQIVVTSDLARLLAIQSALGKGYDCVVWCDADFLIFEPEKLQLGDDTYAFGREVWIQLAGSSKTRLKAYKKLHNAFMFFRKDNPFLSFYIDSIQNMLFRHSGKFAPQFAGPKFLSAINNISSQPVMENAGMYCPLVIRDLIHGSGPALTLFQQKSPAPLAGANLCASLAEKETSNQDICLVIEKLLTDR